MITNLGKKEKELLKNDEKRNDLNLGFRPTYVLIKFICKYHLSQQNTKKNFSYSNKNI